MSSESLSGHGVVGEVFKTLYHGACDHGGGEDSVRRLLSEPDLATRLAKILVGPIWEIIDGEPFELKVDWDTPLLKLGGEGVYIYPFGSEEYEEGDVEPGSYRYSLQYIGSFNPHEVWEAERRDNLVVGSTRVQSATLRELVAFATSGIDYGSHKIVSLGSYKPGDRRDIIFPFLRSRRVQDEIIWTTAEMREGGVVRAYGSYFNLVRVYGP